MSGIGELLRQAREEKQLSLAEVEKETRIRRRYLEALETERFEVIPGNIYLFGFVRSYASFLGLDGDDMVARLKKQYHPESEKPGKEGPPKKSIYFPQRRRVGKILKMLAIILAACLLVVYLYNNFAIRSVPHGTGTSAPTEVETGASETPVVDEDTTPDEEIIQGIELSLSVVDQNEARCWIEVRIDGEPDFQGILEAGDSKTFTAQDTIWLKVGNAGVLSLKYNGEELGSPGGAGEVLILEFPPKEIISE